MALVCAVPALGQDEIVFDDQPLSEELTLPGWFKLSFLDLQEDLEDVARKGKRGLIVYFGQKHCAYCEAHLKNNWETKDIVTYTRKYFEVVAIDVKGQRTVLDLEGNTQSEREFSVAQRTNFTPSLLFYDRQGRLALRLSGYHPPYQFRAALEYVADGHYLREDFRDYLERAGGISSLSEGHLNENDIFSLPPYVLDRSRFKAERPLVVFFEQGKCHACDVLHAGPLSEADIVGSLDRMEVVQLDMWSDTPVLTPDGRRVTAREWADQLGLFHAPTLIFFDEGGREIIRIDSVVWFYRLRNVLDFILSGDYRLQPNFQLWRQARRK